MIAPIAEAATITKTRKAIIKFDLYTCSRSYIGSGKPALWGPCQMIKLNLRFTIHPSLRQQIGVEAREFAHANVLTSNFATIFERCVRK